MESVSEKILDVLNVMRESVKLNSPENKEQLDHLDKIEEYIQKKEE